MRKILYTIIAISALWLTACSLDETPYTQLPESEAYKTPDAVYINTVAGLYSGLRSVIGTDHGNWDMNAITTDEAMIPTRGSDWDDGGVWRSLFRHQWTPSMNMFNNMWNDRYTAIGRCNQSLKIIEEAKAANPSVTFYDTYIAEVRAIRAFAYFYLLDNFARVPIVTSADTPISEIQQSDRSAVYEFVKTELQEVVPHLADAKSSAQGEYYSRITQPAAYFLLAKLALNAEVYNDNNWLQNGSNPAGSTDFTINGQNVGAWEAAVTYCDLIADSGYRLQADYSSNFTVNNEGSEENIFIIPMDPVLYRSANYNQFLRTLHYTHGGAFGMNTWNGVAATVELMQAFGYDSDDVDPRLEKSFYTGKVTGPDGQYVKNGDADFEYLPMTIRLEMSGTDEDRRAGARWAKFEVDRTFQGSGEFVHNDYPLFRYADVLLMKAEALLRADAANATEALNLVNEVRARVGATPLTAVDLPTIEKERQLELSWEGWRRNDMVRFGTFTGAWTDKESSEAYKIVFPIPQNVLSGNTNLDQNPGYE